MISETTEASQMKLWIVIVLLKTIQNIKKNFRNLAYDITMTSSLKTMGNSDLHETGQIIYHIIRKVMMRALRKCNFY